MLTIKRINTVFQPASFCHPTTCASSAHPHPLVGPFKEEEEVRAGAVPGGKGGAPPEAAADAGGEGQEEEDAVDAAGAAEAAPAAKVTVTDETAPVPTNEGGEQKVGAAGGVAGDQGCVSVVADPESAAESLSDLKARNVALTQKLAEFKARVRTLQAQVEEMEVKDEQVIEALREAKDLLVELEQVIEARKDRAGGENVAAADKGALRKLPTDGNEHKTEAAGAATGNTISILVKMMVRAKQLPLVLLLPVDTMHRKLTAQQVFSPHAGQEPPLAQNKSL